jgi:hypothetical protein
MNALGRSSVAQDGNALPCEQRSNPAVHSSSEFFPAVHSSPPCILPRRAFFHDVSYTYWGSYAFCGSIELDLSSFRQIKPLLWYIPGQYLLQYALAGGEQRFEQVEA